MAIRPAVAYGRIAIRPYAASYALVPRIMRGEPWA